MSFSSIKMPREGDHLTWEVSLRRDRPTTGAGTLSGRDEWSIECEVVNESGLLVLASLRLAPTGTLPPSGLTSAVLDEVRVGELLREAYGAVQRAEREVGGWEVAGGGTMHVPAAEARRRTGRAGRSDLWYAKLARDYLDLIAAGSKRPRADLAERSGIKPELVRDQLGEARRRGLLEGGARGRAGGTLSDAAKRLIQEEAAQ